MLLSSLWSGLTGRRAKLTGAEKGSALPWGAPSKAGPLVTLDTALNLSTVWACVRLLSETVGTLPLGLYQKLPGGSRSEAPDGDLYDLLWDAPNAEMGGSEFWECCVAHLAVSGNFLAIKRRLGQRLVALEPVTESFTVRRLSNGRRSYSIGAGTTAALGDLDEDDVFHVRGFGLGHLMGLSPIAMARESMGLALAAEAAAAGVFANGLNAQGIMTTPPGIKDNARQQIEDLLTKGNRPGAPLILPGEFKYHQLSLNPDDAQLLASRAFNVEDLCRWYRVPPFMIGHTEKSTSWGTGLEQQLIGFLTFALSPYLKRIETAIRRQLIPAGQRRTIYAEFAVEGLLRADSAARAAYYEKLVRNGIMTRNEVRSLENLPPHADEAAGQLTIEGNMSTLARIGHNGGPALEP